ncbi:MULTISPECIES: DHH family phosphoesterase [unclassified Lentimonas]|uniref:DHH family phosphoesterase n=1 Tax=unclassified Lentimonas TaxID=2630993 RepID=UPI001327E207|nr:MULTISPECIES: DHH family phosphoesterase [unclassified Lentimonas]CAA6678245.1 Manganese-dependent inorganic pyrophosphatase (EC [Lentimonas sp. CC4]CAA6684859.1 Manganese-dependent inorganic pyrophosphatase (EC [Lentimonas sp. CC6]CAA7076786.1 Manganese-dependent inorganic pyrophosphatase (EC [Lentimonas sp. CC4]CAA7170816.1 Manganese-dependent inorganic pyrophosphatase (EC [Lentimonas sp. CC21]CAA7179621.1 Manganese-dependent inorganic pyrophosphatase (EC [Lentimonas sp. CC8]
MSQTTPHYIAGHKNPDTDSVVAAEVLAWLYHAISDAPDNAIPVRLGPLNQQTRWLFEQADRTPPALRESCLYTAEEIARPVPFVYPDTPLREALETMQRSSNDFVVVVDDANHPLGIVSDRTPRTNYLLQCNIEDLIGTLLDFEHIITGLPLTCLNGFDRVGEVHRLEVPLHKHSITGNWDQHTAIVIGDRDLLVDSIAQNPPAAVILTGVSDTRADEISKRLPCPVYLYRGSVISMMTRLPGCFPASEAMIEEFATIDSLMREDEISRLIKKTPSSLLVLDSNQCVIGSISAMDILRLKRPKLSLVDHSERGQAIHGLADAEIVEIIDHHRLGDVETIQPLSIDARPLGSTASILYERITEAGLKPPNDIAKLLLGALLSDTLLLTSPTCTITDKARAKKLATLAGVELQSFGIEVLRQNDELADGTAASLVSRDCKPFSFEGVHFIAAQIETVDLSILTPQRATELNEAFARQVKLTGSAFGALMVTDVLKSESRVMIVSEDAHWLHVHLPPDLQQNGQAWMLDDFVSRKKQLIPLLLNNIRRAQ